MTNVCVTLAGGDARDTDVAGAVNSRGLLFIYLFCFWTDSLWWLMDGGNRFSFLFFFLFFSDIPSSGGDPS